ncbi:MAG TPA: sulfite exporter TauE/SafE family protein [Planctomycetota bacterium]|nr:sulfite exporter TauE/SafE family protein [Planctomycetota bacterium]HRV81003.1 sulfite exporter TauE/SafE family protein [Planctomycetota bacterium]
MKQTPAETERGPLERWVPAPLLSLFGFLIASLGALCGIGGGLFTTPLAHYGFRYSLRRSVAVSLSVVATTTVSASATELLHKDGAIFGWLVLVLAISALCGNQIGFYLVPRIPIRVLKGFFVVVLMAVGIQVILGSSSGGPEPGAISFSLLEYLGVALLGVSAGILVPLLGIGGGLAMVPGLLFLLPQIGYLGTRATSMAVAAITSCRSLWMYYRRGELDQRTGGWLALGALVGAFVGVRWVHVPGVASAAQVLMGAILCLTSLRFAWDVRPK